MSRVPNLVLATLLLAASLGAAVVPTASAAASVTHLRITTFDGIELAATLFVPDGATAGATPFVLMTHGWAGSRTTTPTGRVGDLLAAGYGVLTWDSRGFGASDGQVELNSPDFEVKDVSALITWLAQNVPEAALDGPDDPRVGMAGGSYAGGIQLLAAAFDPRIDVIAPEITWNDLVQSLGPNGVPKLGWTTALFGAGQATSCSDGGAVSASGFSTGCQTPELARYYALVHATNSIPGDVRAALEYRSPKNYNGEVDIPTLLIQGEPDTLFDVTQAVANYEQIKANGAPVKLWIYDGGHALPGIGSVPNTQASLISPLVVTWMDRYLKGDGGVDTGPEVEYYASGAWHAAASWPPLPERTTQMAGLPALWQAPVIAGPPTSAAYPVAQGPLSLAGEARVSFDVSGPIGPEGIVFVSLGVSTGGSIARLGPQVQPARFAQGPSETRVEIDLVSVAADVPAGSTLVIQFTTSEPTYRQSMTPAVTNVNDIELVWHGA